MLNKNIPGYIVLGLLFIFCLFLAVGCSDSDEPAEEMVVNTMGNTPGNIVNLGIATQQGDWIYYKSPDRGGSIHKMKIDGSEKTKINDDNSFFINIIGDWVYYLKAEDNYIYKIRTDGSERTLISDERADYVTVIEDWVYYLYGAGEGIRKIRTDGTERTVLYDGYTELMCVTEDWIYYLNFDAEPGFGYPYRMRIDGTDNSLIINTWADRFTVENDDWFYYIKFDDRENPYSDSIYKIRPDGTDDEQVLDQGSIGDINVHNGWIYYQSNNTMIQSKIRPDGTENTSISDNLDMLIYKLNVVDEWIFHMVGSEDGYGVYKIRHDGSDWQVVN